METGNLYGVVEDKRGARLPGVTVTLTGAGAPQVQATDAEGRFRFLGLPPATYRAKAELEGFSTVEYPGGIPISANRNTNIEITLQSSVEQF